MHKSLPESSANFGEPYARQSKSSIWNPGTTPAPVWPQSEKKMEIVRQKQTLITDDQWKWWIVPKTSDSGRLLSPHGRDGGFGMQKGVA